MSTDTFTCARCGGTWEKIRTDEEAMAEARGLWSPAELEDTAVICDDCFKEFMPHVPRIRAEMRLGW